MFTMSIVRHTAKSVADASRLRAACRYRSITRPFRSGDTSRAFAPLLNINPTRTHTGDMFRSMMAHYEQSVHKMAWPVWSHLGYANENLVA
jgi:hypothetical protein